MNNLAFAIAKTILNGFDRHFHLFQQITGQAQQRFEQANWQAVQAASRQRLQFYDLRVLEAIGRLKNEFAVGELDPTLWHSVKQEYIQLLQQHKQAELAETFYNSVFCHMFERKYYNNDNIFVETTVDLEKVVPESPIYRSYFPSEQGICRTVAQILCDFKFNQRFENLSRDVKYIIRAFRRQVPGYKYPLEDLRLDILNSLFYRNKGAYIVGRVISPIGEQPFIVPLLNRGNGPYADTLLTSQDQLAIIFGFARAYFFVETQSPSALVSFLLRLIPRKSIAELYNALGFHKHGKTQFYREFLHHLDKTDDKLIIAPGIKGMVMSVFTLPSYPYVFKLIKDKFAPQKSVTPKIVKEKYQLVKLHDRVGRMADTMEYSEVAFPRERFSEELLQELQAVCESKIRFEDNLVVISHCYIERRMTPLNIFLDTATEEEDLHHGLDGYGQAIKQLAAANIFPGDMLLKNFGVSRQGRVIFYDYDEISYMHEVNFRVKPKAMYPEQELADEPFYSVAPGDVFPEELATFVLANKKYRQIFMLYHADLLEAEFWTARQQALQQGKVEDVFPYPEQIRFRPIKKGQPQAQRDNLSHRF